MPKQADTISTTTDTPTTHPLEHQQQREIAAAAAPSPIDTMLKPPQQQVYEEPESAVDVLQKLDEALDHLNHTRNSNEPLTEAITNQFGSAAATTAQQQQGVVEEEQPTEAVKSSSRATRQVESILFSDDFGMNELMILIRGATRYAEETEGRKHVIRSEISEVYKETYARLDQLEKVKKTENLKEDRKRAYVSNIRNLTVCWHLPSKCTCDTVLLDKESAEHENFMRAEGALQSLFCLFEFPLPCQPGTKAPYLQTQK